MNDRYTFGDGDTASSRLRRLAEIYEPATRDLLLRSERTACEMAADLGCGPGWSTRLLHEVLRPRRTVGLDASARYVAEARSRHGRELEFLEHDVTRGPLPIRPELLLCRFLLTHLRDTGAVLGVWADAAAPGARLLVHESESLTAKHPALARYYELVARLQQGYGQSFDVGAQLDRALVGSPWRAVDSRTVDLEIPAAQMAGLHVANLRTWRDDPYARRSFDGAELDALGSTLEAIASGHTTAGVVTHVVRQVIAERA